MERSKGVRGFFFSAPLAAEVADFLVSLSRFSKRLRKDGLADFFSEVFFFDFEAPLFFLPAELFFFLPPSLTIRTAQFRSCRQVQFLGFHFVIEGKSHLAESVIVLVE